MLRDITLSELSRITGVKRRTLQFWTVSGVIRCDPETQHGGPGVPRRYPEDEVIIALILSEIIRMPLGIGALREISEGIREIMNFGPENGVSDPIWFYNSDEAYRLRDSLVDEEHSLRAAGRLAESKAVREKFKGLESWRLFEFARRGITSVNIPGRGRSESDDAILELAVDDVGRWVLNIEHSDFYANSIRSEPTIGETAPAVWSLRLLLNLTRTLARLPKHRGGNAA